MFFRGLFVVWTLATVVVNAAPPQKHVACGKDPACTKDVGNRFGNKYHDAQKRLLNCTALNLAPTMPALNFSYLDTSYTAELMYHEEAEERVHVWIGSLSNDTKRNGTVSIVWDDHCDADTFQLDLVFEDSVNASALSVLSTVPCTDEPQCVWTVDATLTMMPEERVPFDNTAVRRAIAADARKAPKLPRAPAPAPVSVLPTREPASTDDGSEITVLWLYSNTTRQRYGDAAIVSKVQAAVGTANAALNNSHAGFLLKAAAILPISYTEVSMMQTYNDLMGGKIAGVATLRNSYRADLVQVITEATDGCGVGALLTSATSSFSPYAYSVIKSNCMAQYSHLHEILHNLGAQHNPEDSRHITSWSYGEGYRYCNTTGSTAPYFRSIMSYGCANAPRVPYISTSNQTVTYKGRPVGTSTQDNVRVLQQTRKIAAQFR